jgi:hypothetical protein
VPSFSNFSKNFKKIVIPYIIRNYKKQNGAKKAPGAILAAPGAFQKSHFNPAGLFWDIICIKMIHILFSGPFNVRIANFPVSRHSYNDDPESGRSPL